MSDVQDQGQQPVVEEPGEEEVDPFEAELAALGSGPGPGASAAQCDDYNYAVAEIDQRRVAAALEAERVENEERAGGRELTSQTRRPLNVDPRAEFGQPKSDAPAESGDDGTGTAEGT